MTSVVASRYAVVIHAMCETPPRSPTMVGIAVETMVWSRAAMSMPARRALKIRLIRRRVRTIGAAPGSVNSVVGASKVHSLVRNGRRHGCAAPGERTTAAARVGQFGWVSSGGSVRSGKARRQQAPGLVEKVGQGGGEVAGEPAVEGSPHGH